MRHEMLTQRAPFCIGRDGKKKHAESAFRDACRTSSGVTLSAVCVWRGGGGGAS